MRTIWPTANRVARFFCCLERPYVAIGSNCSLAAVARAFVRCRHKGRCLLLASRQKEAPSSRALCTSLFDYALVAAQENAHTHGNIENGPALFHVLFHLKEDERGMRALLARDTSGAALRQFTRGVENLVRAGALGKSFPQDVPEDHATHYLARSYVDTIDWWFANGMAMETEDVYEAWWRMTSPSLE